MPTNPPKPDSPDPRAVLRELVALLAVLAGLAAVVVGAFMVDPGWGVVSLGGVAALGGYLYGRG